MHEASAVETVTSLDHRLAGSCPYAAAGLVRPHAGQALDGTGLRRGPERRFLRAGKRREDVQERSGGEHTGTPCRFDRLSGGTNELALRGRRIQLPLGDDGAYELLD